MKKAKNELVIETENITKEPLNKEENQNQKQVILDKFQKYLLKENKTKATIAGYIRDCSKFLDFIEEQLDSDIAILTDEYVEKFRDRMISSAYSAATINTKINSIFAYSLMLKTEKASNCIVIDTTKYRVNNDSLIELRKKS